MKTLHWSTRQRRRNTDNQIITELYYLDKTAWSDYHSLVNHRPTVGTLTLSPFHTTQQRITTHWLNSIPVKHRISEKFFPEIQSTSPKANPRKAAVVNSVSTAVEAKKARNCQRQYTGTLFISQATWLTSLTQDWSRNKMIQNSDFAALNYQQETSASIIGQPSRSRASATHKQRPQ